MNPGRELDVLVAEKVFGCKPFLGSDGVTKYCKCNMKNQLDNGSHETRFKGIKPYSIDMGYAMEIVDHVRKVHWEDVFSLLSPQDECKLWFAGFEKKWHGRKYAQVYDREAGDTAAHAICMAALKTVENRTQ